VFDHEDATRDLAAVYELGEDVPEFINRMMGRFAGKDALYLLAKNWCYLRVNTARFPSVQTIISELLSYANTNNNNTKRDKIAVLTKTQVTKFVNLHGIGTNDVKHIVIIIITIIGSCI
jgi:hypothetical protein